MFINCCKALKISVKANFKNLIYTSTKTWPEFSLVSQRSRGRTWSFRRIWTGPAAGLSSARGFSAPSRSVPVTDCCTSGTAGHGRAREVSREEPRSLAPPFPACGEAGDGDGCLVAGFSLTTPLPPFLQGPQSEVPGGGTLRQGRICRRRQRFGVPEGPPRSRPSPQRPRSSHAHFSPRTSSPTPFPPHPASPSPCFPLVPSVAPLPIPPAPPPRIPLSRRPPLRSEGSRGRRGRHCACSGRAGPAARRWGGRGAAGLRGQRRPGGGAPQRRRPPARSRPAVPRSPFPKRLREGPSPPSRGPPVPRAAGGRGATGVPPPRRRAVLWAAGGAARLASARRLACQLGSRGGPGSLSPSPLTGWSL